MSSLVEIAGILKKAKKAVVCGHSMPDGDSIGSVLAMGILLNKIGVESYLATPSPVPVMYDFLPGFDKIGALKDFPADCDLAVFLDCTDLGRLGEDSVINLSTVSITVNIDHHVSNEGFANLNYVDPEAAATGEIVFELAKIMGITIEKDLAVNLYTAIAMDTGGFRFSNTTAKTHQIASVLIETGIDVSDTNYNLFEKKDFIHLKLLGYALAELKTAAEGRLAWVTLPMEIMHEFGALDEHAGGIINYPRMLNGVKIGLLFREISPDKFKIGFRSTNQVDVNKLAAIFGGGGHPRASGCSVEGNQQDVEQRVIKACIEALNTRTIS